MIILKPDEKKPTGCILTDVEGARVTVSFSDGGTDNPNTLKQIERILQNGEIADNNKVFLDQ